MTESVCSGLSTATPAGLSPDTYSWPPCARPLGICPAPDYQALSARGVEFQQEPMERDYGIDAAFRDPSGNLWRMNQQG